MTFLNCNVSYCTFNKNNKCVNSCTIIGNELASQCRTTHCNSFEKRKNTIDNVISTSENTKLICRATNCKNNRYEECIINSINIYGDSDVSSTYDTHCGNFILSENIHLNFLDSNY